MYAEEAAKIQRTAYVATFFDATRYCTYTHAYNPKSICMIYTIYEEYMNFKTLMAYKLIQYNITHNHHVV
jgi:hypothetical protein